MANSNFFQGIGNQINETSMTFSHESVELEYYIREGISPVHYDLSDLNKHFQIRASLYRLLGVIPSFFKGKDILEVAPGSGHNSIYTASLLPQTYDLVEPNPSGCKDIIYIFWSLAAGMTCGTASYFIAFASSLIITIVAYILYKTNYGSIYKSEFILQFRYNKSDEKETSYLKIQVQQIL